MAAFVLTRVLTRQALTDEEKTDFEYAATAQVGSVISPEPLDVEAEEYVIPPEEFPAYEDDIYNFDTSSDEADASNDSADGEAEPVPPADADSKETSAGGSDNAKAKSATASTEKPETKT